MGKISSSTCRGLFSKLSNRNLKKSNRSTGQQIDRANGGFCSKFFCLTKISNKTAKGWWNNNIKAARKEMKESVRRYKLRQSPANLRKMEEVKEKYQTAISEAKLKQYKSNTKFLNESKDSTQFWHRYNKVLGKKQITLLSPSTTLNLAYTSLMIRKYQRNSENST